MNKLFIIILLFTSLCLWAQNVPQTIDYQGRLADSDGNYLNSVVTVDFLIYDAETGGTLLWSETQDVSTANGIFHVQLGSLAAFPSTLFDGADRWLELIVSGETLSPRTVIASVPYSLKAEDADLLDGLNSSNFALSAHNHSASNITSGTLDTGRYSAYSDLSAEGYLNNNSSTDLLTRDQGDTRWINTTGDTMTGELIVLNNVGIGTTSPFSKFQVEDNTPDDLTLSIHNINTSGSERLYFGESSSSDAGIIVWGSTNSSNPGKWRFLNNKTSANYDWITSGSISMTLDNNGNLGIGTTTPTNKLGVVGNFYYPHSVINGENTASGAGVRGIHTSSGNCGFLGDWMIGVYGYSSMYSAGYFSGDVTYTGTLTGPSDERFKENVHPFKNALSKIKLMDVHTYNYIPMSEEKQLVLPEGEQIGLIAQELEEILPELVEDIVHAYDKNKNIENAERDMEQIEYKGINYIGLIPVLIEAMQEQQEQIEELQRQINELR